MARKTKKKSNLRRKYVVVNNSSYGSKLKGIRIFYEGKKPSGLSRDGRIKFGKHILEILKGKYAKAKFHWIVTEETDSITIERGIYRVRTSLVLLSRLSSRLFDRTRDMKLDIVKTAFASAYSGEFEAESTGAYVPGALAALLAKNIVPNLSSEDGEALKAILPDFISAESIASVNLLKAAAQIQSLRELAVSLKKAIEDGHSESWWQDYIRTNILIIQQGYIKAIEKMNVSIGGTKFPDFSLVTHDSYLDILEIKKPATELLKLDSSRDNFYWDTEISKAIVQVENYIANVSRFSDAVRAYLMDKHKINLQVLRPRGIIIAGDRRTFAEQKKNDDFRLLTQGLKNITLLTYDELLVRLENYIEVLEQHRSTGNPQDVSSQS